MKDALSIFGKVLLVAIVSLIVLAVVVWGLGLIQVPLYSIERKGIQQSLPYVQSKQVELTTLTERYQSIEVEVAKFEGNENVVTQLRSQQKAILIEMRQAANLIPEDAVPNEARALLRRGGR